LATLKAALDAGLHGGVSLMPLLPYITDTGDNLTKMFEQFAAIGAKYLFPASLTLFGNGPADSKTLVLRAVERHYPHLLPKYQQWFAQGQQMPDWYRVPFGQKMEQLCRQYGLKSRIV
jgi:DNA repair photolyase